MLLMLSEGLICRTVPAAFFLLIEGMMSEKLRQARQRFISTKIVGPCE